MKFLNKLTLVLTLACTLLFVGCEDDDDSSRSIDLTTPTNEVEVVDNGYLHIEEVQIAYKNDVAYEVGDLGVTYVDANGEYEIVATTNTIILTTRQSCSGLSESNIQDVSGTTIIYFYASQIDWAGTPAIVRPYKIVSYRDCQRPGEIEEPDPCEIVDPCSGSSDD